MDDLTTRLAEREGELRETERARARLSNDLADRTHALEAAQARETDLRTQLDSALEAQRDDARKSAERAQSLRAERDALQGALEAARREAAALRDELSVARQSQDAASQEDDVLRRTITEIGAEVLRLTSALERQADGEDASPAERVQRLQKSAGRASSLV